MQMATKDAVAQEIIAHEGIYKAAKLLDQFCDGLQALRLLSLMRAFPVVFAPLFTFTGEIDVAEVVDGLYVGDEVFLTPDNEVIMEYLRKFILQSDKKGETVAFFISWVSNISSTELERFLMYATGKKTVSKIQIDFLIAISAHTCANLIVFPQGNSFKSWKRQKRGTNNCAICDRTHPRFQL